MFYIPHYHYHVEEWTELKDTTLEILSKKFGDVFKKDLPKKETLHTTYHSGNTNPNLVEFQMFLSMIAPYLQDASDNIIADGFSSEPILEVKEIWFQTQNFCEYHRLHNHGCNGWSSVFYADFDPEEHESTIFYCPVIDAKGGVLNFQPKVQEGDLIIFPAQINHESVVNKSKKPRSIISFNIQ